MSTFDYKDYSVTVDTDAPKYFPSQLDSVRGIYAIWRSAAGEREREIYRGQTVKTFKASDIAEIIAASEEAARAWIDANAGKPWA